MNLHDAPGDFFTLTTSTVIVLSFIVGVAAIATLRRHVDEEKIRSQPSVSAVFRARIPPENVLTEAGRRNVKIAKIALTIWAITIGIVIARVQFVSR